MLKISYDTNIILQHIAVKIPDSETEVLLSSQTLRGVLDDNKNNNSEVWVVSVALWTHQISHVEPTIRTTSVIADSNTIHSGIRL
jgi:hypothetical protein